MGYSYLFKLVFLCPLDKYPKVELLCYMTVLFLIFQGFSILFSIMAVSIYIPVRSAQRFPFHTSWPALVIFYLFDNSHSNRYEEIIHCGFDLHLPDD